MQGEKKKQAPRPAPVKSGGRRRMSMMEVMRLRRKRKMKERGRMKRNRKSMKKVLRMMSQMLKLRWL